MVVLGDGEALALARRVAVDLAVDLEQHAPLRELEPGVGVRLLDHDRLAARVDVEELAAVAAGRRGRRRRRAPRPPPRTRARPRCRARRDDELLRQAAPAQTAAAARRATSGGATGSTSRSRASWSSSCSAPIPLRAATACEMYASPRPSGSQREPLGEKHGERPGPVTPLDSRPEHRHQPAGARAPAGPRRSGLPAPAAPAGSRERSWRRIDAVQRLQLGAGSMPSSSTRRRRASWYAASASAWRPDR